MLVIIEGPDGSGKTTLIPKLAKDLGYEIYYSGGPKDIRNMIRVLAELENMALANETYICDRVPWVSEIVYNDSLKRENILPQKVYMEYLNLPQKMIYCSLNSSNKMLKKMSREYKAHKPKEHLSAVIKNHNLICENYELIMGYIETFRGITGQTALIKYNWELNAYNCLKEKL
tara:strand:- start:6229 stop:6750 length:522 start_codon:yes stop_codon:yes gene_type:complete